MPLPVIEPVKEVEYVNNGVFNISPTNGDGIAGAKITVNVPIQEINNQNKTVSIIQNGNTSITFDPEYTGLGIVTINTNVTPKLEEKSVSITENGTHTIIPSSNYDGISEATISVNVPDQEMTKFKEAGYSIEDLNDLNDILQPTIDWLNDESTNLNPTNMDNVFASNRDIIFAPGENEVNGKRLNLENCTSFVKTFYLSSVYYLPS